MKQTLVSILTLISLNSFSQTLLSQCYNYSYATDNVYEDQFNITVKTNEESFDSFVEKKLWDLLQKSYVKVLSLPQGVEVGSSIEKKGNVRLIIKVDLSQYTRAENLVEVLKSLPSVDADCQFKIK